MGTVKCGPLFLWLEYVLVGLLVEAKLLLNEFDLIYDGFPLLVIHLIYSVDHQLVDADAGISCQRLDGVGLLIRQDQVYVLPAWELPGSFLFRWLRLALLIKLDLLGKLALLFNISNMLNIVFRRSKHILSCGFCLIKRIHLDIKLFLTHPSGPPFPGCLW